MTSKNSPRWKLEQQAKSIASILKKAERGEPIGVLWAERLKLARTRPTFKAGIVMDDKTIILELTWTLIKETEEKALVEYIINQMQEKKPDQ